ncbi:MAG: cytochrome c oxidase assembly protein subunit 11 [Granulosicoccus sp.]|jgi:cytochrome c oxidase assembly protein subunit 11
MTETITMSGKKSHAKVVGKMAALAFAMFGFGYLMVPLYDIICDITGINGKTGRVSSAEATAAQSALVAEDRTVIVEFVAGINQSGSWIFKPTDNRMIVTPGKLYHSSYFAENLSSNMVVAQATPSVSPFSAARYFNKTECFCFTRQAFEPNGSRDMPLTFIIDEDLPINIDRITLSYTLFRSPDQS